MLLDETCFRGERRYSAARGSAAAAKAGQEHEQHHFGQCWAGASAVQPCIKANQVRWSEQQQSANNEVQNLDVQSSRVPVHFVDKS